MKVFSSGRFQLTLLPVKFTILVLFSVTTLCLIASAQVGILPKKDFSLKQVSDPKFRVGDVWAYRTRPGESESRLTILRIDESPELGIIVHLAVDKIKLTNCREYSPDSLPHMPFARKALDASVTKKIAATQRLPAFEDGYGEWRSAYARNEAGIYIISVAEALGVAEKTYAHGMGCDSGPSPNK